MKSILIIDDHPFIRHSCKTIISSIEKYCNYVVYECDNIKEASKYIETKPYIAIVDLNLGDQSGLSIIKEINEKSAKTKIIVISIYEDIEMIWLLVKMNVKAFIPKSCDITILKEVLEKIDDINGCYLPKNILSKYNKFNNEIFDYLINNIKYLSVQEKLVLKLKIKGFNNDEIANILNIKIKTVENHINNIKNKVIPPPYTFKEFLDKYKDTLQVIIPLLN
ncbi:MAG: response regulator transcription factor [Bacteroidales bacterium]|nr:response regulator transcription factor [Bacteroidales bacterium]